VGDGGPLTLIHRASNWTHWATLRHHPCLSRAATSASSQVNPIFRRSLLTHPDNLYCVGGDVKPCWLYSSEPDQRHSRWSTDDTHNVPTISHMFIRYTRLIRVLRVWKRKKYRCDSFHSPLFPCTPSP